VLAYRAGYPKANLRAEYMAAQRSSVMDTKDRVPFDVSACAEMGLDVLPPDVNASEASFAVTGGREIRFGLTAVKGVGCLDRRGYRGVGAARMMAVGESRRNPVFHTAPIS